MQKEQLEDHKRLKKDVSNLTDSTQSMSTRLDTALTIDEVRVKTSVQQFIQSGINSPIGEDDNAFRDKVVEILHEHYPNVSPECISGMLQHESEVHAKIETRLYERIVKQLREETTSKQHSSNTSCSPPDQQSHQNNQTPNHGSDSNTATAKSTDYPNGDPPPNDNNKPPTASGDGMPDKDDLDEPAGYAGYVNQVKRGIRKWLICSGNTVTGVDWVIGARRNLRILIVQLNG